MCDRICIHVLCQKKFLEGIDNGEETFEKKNKNTRNNNTYKNNNNKKKNKIQKQNNHRSFFSIPVHGSRSQKQKPFRC